MAAKFGGEIISADSRQVYRKLDIGSGKDLEDYIVDKKKIPFHLINVAEPDKEFNLFEYLKMFSSVYDDLIKQHKISFLTGGSGLYLSAVVQNYKLKEADFSKLSELDGIDSLEGEKLLRSKTQTIHNTTDLENIERIKKAIIVSDANKPLYRPSINSLNIGIVMPLEKIKKNISFRLKNRIERGMIEETESLLKEGVSYERLYQLGLEYRFLAMYLTGKLNYNDMFQKLNSAIYKFARRQLMWFRKMEKEGVKIEWLEEPDFEAAASIVKMKYLREL